MGVSDVFFEPMRPRGYSNLNRPRLYILTMMSRFPIDLVHIISDYVAIWTIVPWVRAIEDTIKISAEWPATTDSANIKRYNLYMNPMAMDEIESQKIVPASLVHNSADWAFDMIEPNISRYELDASDFCRNTNPRAIAYIEKNIDTLTPDSWNVLLRNSGAIEFIKKYNGLEKASQPDEIYRNSNEAVWELIKNQLRDVIEYRWSLSQNSSLWAARLLPENNIEPSIVGLCSNTHPDAIKNVSSNIEMLDDDDWESLCLNPAAIHILREHQDKITDDIWSNPAIFELTQRPGVLDILTELSWPHVS